MQRRDYLLLGRAFRSVLRRFFDSETTLTGKDFEMIKKYHTFLLDNMMEYIKDENPLFDKTKFIEKMNE